MTETPMTEAEAERLQAAYELHRAAVRALAAAADAKLKAAHPERAEAKDEA